MAARESAPLRRWQVRMPLRRPWSGLTYRDVTIVGGAAGFGESSPLPGFACDPAQSQRFIDLAREAEADDRPDAMDRAFDRVVKPKQAKPVPPSGGSQGKT